MFFFFFFQAEDGIRDPLVTGVQRVLFRSPGDDLQLRPQRERLRLDPAHRDVRAMPQVILAHQLGDDHELGRCQGFPVSADEIGRASCREREDVWAGAGTWRTTREVKWSEE